MTAIRQIRCITLGAALAAATVAAFAQAPVQGGGETVGVAVGVGAHSADSTTGSGGTGTGQRIVAPGPVDPLVQKRDAEAAANAEYSANKKALKQEYHSQLKAAKQQHKAAKRDAAQTLNEQTGGAAADKGAQN
ncbi:hypothetical protein KPG66_03040 [Mycetohabitans sp. B2]|uniref:hypothetical protein n=1 Tax=Mycetohabitans sp. B2 TaxID=2841274 RepID=UPI001F2BD5BF|nr:hypothetical protein [Mycetohabitans sp. B2]MCF7695132.1 hypothetical protein [Mycetohabitans sp. B2]